MRTHLVLVPGFGGFDALGALRYYAGVTTVFDGWAAKHDGVALHYFDNLPTAAVKTRARELRAWLGKRLARREIGPRDRIVLAGHSTGGLDIRQLLRDLETSEDDVDGIVLRGPDILDRIRRIVFLSVPQRGTNIADWVRSIGWIDQLVRVARVAVGLDAEPSLVLEPTLRLLRLLRRRTPGILIAARDVERDIGRRFETDPWRNAAGRQSFADLKLWFENVDEDFLAIDDLASRRRDERHEESHDESLGRAITIMKDRRMVTRTYATLAERPFELSDVVAWRTREKRSLFAMTRLVRKRTRNVDVTYAAGYAACAAGPFAAESVPAPWLDGQTPPGFEAEHAPEAHENDGVVNTASMLCADLPDDQRTLVYADHGDIIGHFAFEPETDVKTARQSDGMRDRYDLLVSSSGFDVADFERIWTGIFDFAANAT